MRPLLAQINMDPNWVIAVATVLAILGGVCTFFWKDIDGKIKSLAKVVEKVTTSGESTARELAELRGRFNEMRSGGERQWRDER